MLDKNKSSSFCSYSEQLISYLYKEMEKPEANEFETHLQTCAFCFKELSGFDVILSSISEWRKVEFSTLETPVLDFLPVQTNKININSQAEEKNWWIAIKDRFFPASPIFAASAFAALLICFGLAFIVFDYPKKVEVAEFSIQNGSNVISPIIETKNSSDNNSGTNQIEKSSGNFVEQPQLIDKATADLRDNSVPGNFVSKIKNDSNQAPTRKSTRIAEKTALISRKPGTPKQDRKTLLPKSRNAPFLADIEEVEDDTLRLADLFDGTDAK